MQPVPTRTTQKIMNLLHRTLAVGAALSFTLAAAQADHHLSVHYKGKDGPGKGV